MLKQRVAAAALALATAVVGAVLVASPAQASDVSVVTTTIPSNEDCLQPQKEAEVTVLSFDRKRIELPCRQVEFADNCDETVTVKVANTASNDSPFEVRFKIERDGADWFSAPLGGGESDSVVISAAENQNIQVESRYPAGVGPYLAFGDEHDWAWNASCLAITSVSSCDNTFKVSVKNISTEDGTFKWQLGLGASTETDILAGATLSQTFNKGDVVSIRHGVSSELVKTLEFVQPKGCTTPPPSTPPTSAPPAGGGDDNGTDDGSGGGLAVTGTPLAGTALASGIALLLAAIAGSVLWARKRRQQTL